MNDVEDALKNLTAIGLDSSLVSAKQLKVLGTMIPSGDTSFVEEYIAKIQEIRDAQNLTGIADDLFNSEQLIGYTNALKNLTPVQQAAILSTQGLSNAQIQQVLSTKKAEDGSVALTAQAQYEAMADAGLLTSKKALTAAQMEQVVQTALGTDADVAAIATKLGLKTTIDAEGNTIYKVTAAKIADAIASGTLTKEEGLLLASAAGVNTQLILQAKSVLPALIKKLGLTATAISTVVKETAKWLIMTPAGWATLAVGALAGVAFGFKKYQEAVEEARKETELAADQHKETADNLNNAEEKYKEYGQALKDAGDDEEKIYAAKKNLLDLQNDLNEKYGDAYGKINLVTEAYDEQATAIRNLSKAAASEFLNDKDNRDSLKRAEKKMTEKKTYTLTPYDMSYGSEYNAELRKIAEKYKDQGMQISDGSFDDTFNIKLVDVDPTQAYQTIQQFETDVRAKAKELGNEHLFDNVLNISGNASDKAKDIIDKWKSIREEGQMANIAEDDTLTKQMDEASDAVEKYNDALLKSKNPYEDEDVKAAYDDIQKIKASLQDEDGNWIENWQKYGNIIADVFDKADTKVYDFAQQLKSDNGLKEYTDQLKGMSDVDVKALIDSDDKSIAGLKQSANEAGIGIEQLISVLKLLGVIEETASTQAEEVTKPFTKSEMISKINGLSEGFEELDKIMSSIIDKDKAFDFSLLDDKKFKENFQDYTKEYNNFIETITKHPKDIKACQSAFDDLTTAYIYNSDVMKGLSDDTADVAAQYLKLMGVSNSEEVVASALAQKHAEAAWNSRDLSNATADEIDALANESEQTDQNRESFKLYIAQKILASDAFDPTGDITALSKIVESLGIASNAWIKYNTLRNQILQMDATAHVSNGRTYYSYTSKDKNGNTVNHLATQEEYDNYNKQMENQLNDFSDDITAKLKADMRVSNTGGNKTLNTGASNAKSSKDSEKDPTTFDWMERKLTILDKQTSTLQDKIDNLVGYKAKNQVTDTVLDLLGDKLTTLEKMSARYQEQLNSIDLPEEWIEKIQSGAYDIDSLDSDKDKTLIKKIQDYQTWYDKIQDCKDKIDETTKSIKEMNLSKLDNIIDQFDQTKDILSQIIDTEKDLLDLREQQGEKISANDYISLANKQYEATKQNIEEYNRLSAEMSKLNLEHGSEEWKKYNDQLQDLKNNMIAAADAVESYKDAMTELVYKDLDDYKSKLDSLNGTISTMSGLIGDTNLVNDNGELTDRGLAQLALYAQQLSNAKHEAAEYDNAIDSLNDVLRTGLITQDEYNSMLYEYKSAQESAVSSVKDARDSILALVKDGIQAEIDAKKELIDQTKAELEAEQDLHDYQESIADQQKNITNLQRQIATLSDSTERKDIAQKLKLQSDLAEAQKKLYDTQYDHELDERKKALDDEYNTFEESKQKEMEELETDLDKQEAAISKYLDKVKKDHSTAYDILKQYGENYNLTATDDLTEPWESASSAADTCSDAIGNVTANIQYQINSLDFSSLYELINLLNTIKGLGYGNGDATNSQWEDISGTGTWHKSTASGRWWYGADEDNYASDGIYTIDGKQYGFNGKGQMVTGWRNDIGDDGTWKYFEPSNGQMVRSAWRKSKDGTWCYLDHNGEMATDMAVKAKDGNGYYYVDNDGKWDGTTLTTEDVNRLKYKIGYKNGTKNATPGYHPVFEDGTEIITLKDGTVLYPFKGGETVLDHAKTERFMNSLRTTMPRFTDGFKNSTLDNVKVKDVVQTINIDMPIGGVLDEAAARVLSKELPGYLEKNGKVICNMVAKDMTKSTRW